MGGWEVGVGWVGGREREWKERKEGKLWLGCEINKLINDKNDKLILKKIIGEEWQVIWNVKLILLLDTRVNGNTLWMYLWGCLQIGGSFS